MHRKLTKAMIILVYKRKGVQNECISYSMVTSVVWELHVMIILCTDVVEFLKFMVWGIHNCEGYSWKGSADHKVVLM